LSWPAWLVEITAAELRERRQRAVRQVRRSVRHLAHRMICAEPPTRDTELPTLTPGDALVKGPPQEDLAVGDRDHVGRA
jgi:hypothetical protein